MMLLLPHFRPILLIYNNPTANSHHSWTFAKIFLMPGWHIAEKRKKYICPMTPHLAFNLLVTFHRAYARTWRQGSYFFRKRQKCTEICKNREFLYQLWKGQSHKRDYRTRERPIISLVICTSSFMIFSYHYIPNLTMIPLREQKICRKKRLWNQRLWILWKLWHKRLWSINFKSHAFKFFLFSWSIVFKTKGLQNILTQMTKNRQMQYWPVWHGMIFTSFHNFFHTFW